MTHSYNDCTLQIIETYLKLISTEATEVHVINLKVGHCGTTQFSYGGSFLIFISRVPMAQQVQRQNTKLVVCAKICTKITHYTVSQYREGSTSRCLLAYSQTCTKQEDSLVSLVYSKRYTQTATVYGEVRLHMACLRPFNKFMYMYIIIGKHSSERSTVFHY